MWEQWSYDIAGGARRKESLNTSPSVLFCDSILGIWAPLQCFYWSGDSHGLVSTHPASSTYEISSSYCPGCFEIASREDGRCTTCMDCPVCNSNLNSTCGLDGLFYWSCSHCPWDSTEVLTANSSQNLAASLDRLVLESNKETDDTLALLKAYYSEPQTTPRSRSTPSASDDALRSASWQPADADELVARKAAERSVHPSAFSPLQGSGGARWVARGRAADVAVTARAEANKKAARTKLLLPQRRPLMARKERRSVVDVRGGKPGILVMPKVNPLEGDSSSTFKSKKSEWWRKMKSASQFVPRLTIARLPSSEDLAKGCATLLLRVSNPRYYKVTIWIGPGKDLHASGDNLGGVIDSPSVLDLLPPDGDRVGWRSDDEKEEEASLGINLEAAEDFLVGDLSSEGLSSLTAASADARGAPSLLVRLENDTAWLQIALSEESTNHSTERAGFLCASVTLTMVEHDPNLQEENKKPITVPFLVTIPRKCLK